MSTIKTIGKAKIDLEIRGCIDCGSEASSGWEVAQIIEIKIGSKSHQGTIHRCADCTKQRLMI